MRRHFLSLAIVTPFVIGACGSDVGDVGARPVMSRRTVTDAIRTVCTRRGITNSLLVAGIANHETNLAHCVEDYYVHKCMQAADTPKSQSCGGTSVTIGNADAGGCIRGGMGLFQIDAGTQEDTIAKYGSAVVELEGNTDIAIDHLLSDLGGCTDAPALGYDPNVAMAWLNSIVRNTSDYDRWFQCVAKHYNGCFATKGCNQNARADQYRKSTDSLVTEFGEAYWR